MRCRDFRRLIVLAKEAELTHQQRTCGNRHHAECLPCRQFCREMRTVEHLLSLVRMDQASVDFSGAVMQRIRQTPTSPRRPGFFPWFR